MPSSPLAPGMRTDSGRDAGAVVGAAGAVVAADPVLWLLGIVGFGARGGLVLLALPVLTIPSPVLLSIVFRNELDTSGTTASFDVLAILMALLIGTLAFSAILVSAWAELQAVERAVAAPGSWTLRLGRPSRQLGRSERRSLLLWVASVQAGGLVPVLLVVLLLTGRLSRVVSSELQQPSDLSTPLIDRLIRDAAPAIAGLVLLFAVMEVVVSLASRRLIVARLGLLPDGAGEPTEGRLAARGALRLVRQPVRVGGVAVLSWLTALLAMVVAVGGVSLAWGLTRQGLLSLGRTDDPGALLGSLLLAFLLSAVWIGAFCLCGLASAFRSSLWTMDTLR